MASTRLSPERRRQLILEAARQAFTASGYEGASMRQIALDSGVTTPVLYDHFPSKAALYLHLLQEEADALVDVTAALRADGSLQEVIASGVEAFFAFVERRPQAWRLLTRDVPGDPEIAARHREAQRRGDRAIAQALARAPALSHALPGEDDVLTEGLAVAIRAMVNGLAGWWWDHPDVPRAAVVALVTDLLTHGLDGAAQQGRNSG